MKRMARRNTASGMDPHSTSSHAFGAPRANSMAAHGRRFSTQSLYGVFGSVYRRARLRTHGSQGVRLKGQNLHPTTGHAPSTSHGPGTKRRRSSFYSRRQYAQSPHITNL